MPGWAGDYTTRVRRYRPRASRLLRRRSTLWLLAALAALAVSALLAALSGGGGVDAPEATSPATVATSTTTALPRPTLTPTTNAVAAPDLRPDRARLDQAELIDVIDGDTLDVRLDGRDERVRLYGVDTPERGEQCFREAAERLEALAGEGLLLLPDARERDGFDRLLRYAFAADGRSIDALLIAEGLGLAWREDGAYRDELVALEEQARLAGAGCLWGSEE